MTSGERRAWRVCKLVLKIEIAVGFVVWALLVARVI